MYCVVCGLKIKSNKELTVEHIFPAALYKWALAYGTDTSESEILECYIESDANKKYSHKTCNDEKAEQLPKLNLLSLRDNEYVELSSLSITLEPYYKRFTRFKKEILYRQKHRCYLCRRKITDGIIRRIDNKKPRTESNACMLCTICTPKFYAIRKRRLKKYMNVQTGK